MVEELAEKAAYGVLADLLSSGIAAGKQSAVSKVRSILRKDKVSSDLGEVATEFHQALEDGIETANTQLETLELSGFTDNWAAIAEELAATQAAPTHDTRRDGEEINILFTDEAEAVTQIAEAYATVENIPLDEMPEARRAIKTSLTHAYRRAVDEFLDTIEETDLEWRFQQETNLVIVERLYDLQERLTELDTGVEQILTQAAYNEGFRQFSSAFFERQSPSPEQCWRVGFSLADVEAGIPAPRSGTGDTYAHVDLLESLENGANQMVVGRPGSGKSTLCKQVAIGWYEDEHLGDVVYRETGAGHQFESTEALKQGIHRAQNPVLVVVEDAVREQARRIAEIIEEFEAADGVRFLLDSRLEELDTFETAGSMDVSADRRRGSVLANMERYPLSPLSVGDVEAVCTAFTDATGRTIRRKPTVLHNQLRAEMDLGIGEMLLLSFFLPATNESRATDGLRAHVKARYEKLTQRDEPSRRDLSKFDQELLADVGVMVNLLNASEIGIHQGLVHALTYEHGHDIDTHDTIEEILRSLEGWVLFSKSGDGPMWQTHPLWSILYLRELAQTHAERQAATTRAQRSEQRMGRCLTCLFELFDDDEHREALKKEFPHSPVLSKIESTPQQQADEYLEAIFELGKRWPVLAVLFGTTETARYELPAAASDGERQRTITLRGHAHRGRGAYAKAMTEFEYRLKQSRKADDQAGIARSLGNLGMVARDRGEYKEARAYLKESLEIFEDIGDRPGIATRYKDLGVVAVRRGEYETAREYLEESEALFETIADRNGIATTLGSLGLVAEELGNYEQAAKYHHRCREISEELGDRIEIGNSLHNLGVVARERGDYEEASTYLNESLQIFRELGERGGIADSLGALGVVARERDNYQEACEYFKDILDIFEELGDRGGIAYGKYNLGLVACGQDDYDDGREKLTESRDIFEELGAVKREFMARRNLIQLEINAGATDRANKRWEKAVARLNELDGDWSEERTELYALRENIS